ncbi:MAG: hypothetical protein V4437_00565, partial [Patescibacteria group bacterium]
AVSPGASHFIKDSGLDAGSVTEGARNVVTWATEHPKISAGVVLAEIFAGLITPRKVKAERRQLKRLVENAPPPW